jgi:hypothetical protein
MPITPAARAEAFPFVFTGKIRTYSFAVIELSEELPPNVNIEVTRSDTPSASDPCKESLNLLWKPLPGAIAIYAVGCESETLMDYRVEIRAVSEP